MCSKLSGQCDLYDHIAFEKMYDKGNCRVSDLLECFEIFKNKTGGEIYKPIHIDEVTVSNQDYIAKYNSFFTIIKHEEDRQNKASKSGFKHVVWYTYKIYGKELTAKQIKNMGGISVYKPVKFDTLLDLLLYLPHGVSMMSSSEGKERVFITAESLADRDEIRLANSGHDSLMAAHYKKALAELYLKVCKDYFLYKADERQTIEPVRFIDKENGIAEAADEIDYMHPIEFRFKDCKPHSHWSDPKLIDGKTYQISKEDITWYLQELFEKEEVLIIYYKKCEIPKELT